MDEYKDSLAPLLDSLIEETSNGKISWEETGLNSFRYISSDTSIIVAKLYDGHLIKDRGISIKIYNKDECLYNYTPSFLLEEDDFDKRLHVLFSKIEQMKFNKFSLVVKGVIDRLKKK